MTTRARIAGLLRRLRHDENGSVLVFATFAIVVMMGMVGLALDRTRYFSLNSELQNLADAAALAGAAELNGTLAGVTAAVDRARNLLAAGQGVGLIADGANTPRWGESGPTDAQ